MKAFIARRRTNWLWLAFLYGSFYALRYNLSLANAPIREEFGFSKAEFGYIITATYIAYAIGQFVNGPIVDKFGGKRMMLFGAFGTIAANIWFGLSAYTGLLNLFICAWVLNGYMQAYGAPGNIRVNSHWFKVEERGIFSGLFTAVVYLGRLAIMLIGPIIIAHCHWKWVFIAPAIFACLVSLGMYAFVKETPKEAGLKIDFAESVADDHKKPTFWTSLKIVMTNKFMWITGFAYLSTGVVRNGLEQWFPSYLTEIHNFGQASWQFGAQAALMPISALLGAISAGYISDKLFNSRRGPVVALMYFAQAVVLVFFMFAKSPMWCGISLIVLSFLFSGPHSIIGTAVAMDFGGKEASATAHGFVDAMQYIGGSLVGVFMGKVIDVFGWGAWGTSLIAFAVGGGLLMCSIWKVGGHKKERDALAK